MNDEPKSSKALHKPEFYPLYKRYKLAIKLGKWKRTSDQWDVIIYNVCLSKRSLSPWADLPTGESRNTRYIGWCPGWCWPTVGLPAHSHNSWHCQGYTGLAAVHFLLSIISLLTHFQNLGFLWMGMISYPASKRIKNYLLKIKNKGCNTMLYIYYMLQTKASNQ